MTADDQKQAEERMEQFLGNLLRAGVLLAAAVVLVGGAIFLFRHGSEQVDLGQFQGEPAELRHPVEIIAAAWTGHSRPLIQVGLLILVATPVARVAFSVLGFLRQRDWVYVAITLFVLALLLVGLLGKLPS